MTPNLSPRVDGALQRGGPFLEPLAASLLFGRRQNRKLAQQSARSTYIEGERLNSIVVLFWSLLTITDQLHNLPTFAGLCGLVLNVPAGIDCLSDFPKYRLSNILRSVQVLISPKDQFWISTSPNSTDIHLTDVYSLLWTLSSQKHQINPF